MKLSYANAALLAASLIAGTAFAQGVSKSAPPIPAGKTPVPAAKAAIDLTLLQEHCSSCHAVDQVTAQNKTADEWAETMGRMIDHGMQITPDDNKRITAFLIAHYGAN